METEEIAQENFNNFYVAWVTDFNAPRILRKGQHAFNFLHKTRPDLSEQVMGTKYDPFYTDSRLKAFWSWVSKNW